VCAKYTGGAEMKLNIIVFDGNPDHLAYLKQTISEYDTTQKFEVLTYSDPFQLDRDLKTISVDVAILDLSIGEANGIQLAQNIKLLNSEASIVFVAGQASFSVGAFEIRAIHYLVKPVMTYKIHAILDQVIASRTGEKTTKEMPRSFTVETRKRYVRLDYDQILYFEKDQRKVIVHTENSSYDFYGTFKEIRELLDMEGSFVQCHQGFIVNIHKVLELSHEGVRIEGNQMVPVSRRFYNVVEGIFDRLSISAQKRDSDD
jgi:DNA-binding LytR/AlgR family response regulator